MSNYGKLWARAERIRSRLNAVGVEQIIRTDSIENAREDVADLKRALDALIGEWAEIEQQMEQLE